MPGQPAAGEDKETLSCRKQPREGTATDAAGKHFGASRPSLRGQENLNGGDAD